MHLSLIDIFIQNTANVEACDLIGKLVTNSSYSNRSG